MTAGDRVRWKAEYDPMTAVNTRLGLTSPAGTIDSVADGVAYVIWDSNEGEAQGNMSPHKVEELEAIS
jgi:hypothetical protein